MRAQSDPCNTVALRPESWNQFVTGLGFGPDMLVEA